MSDEIGGYTLGNPEAYEPALDRNPEDTWKLPGGAVFLTREAAEAALAMSGGRLPKSWFPEHDLPGQVYGLVAPVEAYELEDDVGAARLKAKARIVRLTGAL